MYSLIELPKFVDENEGVLKNVKVIGLVDGEVTPPYHMKKVGTNHDTAYVVVTAIGLIYNNTYYTMVGRILTIAPGNLIRLMRRKKSGKLAVIMRGSLKLASNMFGNPYLEGFTQMINWRKTENGFLAEPVDIRPFANMKDTEPEYFKIVSKLYKNNWNFDMLKQGQPYYSESCGNYKFTFVTREESIIDDVVGAPQRQAVTNADISLNDECFQSSNLGVDSTTAPLGVKQYDIGGNLSAPPKRANVRPNRDEIIKPSKNFIYMNEQVASAGEKIEGIIAELNNYEITPDNTTRLDKMITYCGQALKSNWRSKNGSSITGKALLKGALERILEDSVPTGALDTCLSHYDTSLVDAWITADTDCVNAMYKHSDDEESIVDILTHQRGMLYFKIVEVLLGIRAGKITDTYKSLEGQDLSLLTILEENPYKLSFVDHRLNIEDLDKLAMLYGTDIRDEEVKKMRNIAYMHNYMLDSSNPCIGDNTLVKYGVLLHRLKAGYSISDKSYTCLLEEGCILPYEKVVALSTYIDANVVKENFALPTDGWKRNGIKYTLTQGLKAEDVLKDYISSGLGVSLVLNKDSYVSDYIFAKKEIFVYNYLYSNSLEFSDICRDVPKEELDKTILEFENRKAKELELPQGGFKLEERQRGAVYLTSKASAVVTGGAGSGKTTTAEAMVYALQKHHDLDDDEILFVAPTGRASARLKEVIKRPTRTIHSLFCVSGEMMSLKEDDMDFSWMTSLANLKALVVDECSMITLDLMYQLLLKLSARSVRLFFLGDVDQLPPIGFGKPFANMLSFLPCVSLNVSKRASEASNITRNCKDITENSDDYITDLVGGEDFKIINTKDEKEIVNTIKGICNYHKNGIAPNFEPIKGLDGLSPDDIQIVSPVAKKDYIWGTKSLNETIHDIFNPRRGNDEVLLYRRTSTDMVEFRVGDRVIHLKNEDRERLVQGEKPNQFGLSGETGVVNGDLGKIKGFFRVDELDFSIDENHEKKLKETFKGNENTIYIAVAYKDVAVDDNSGTYEYIILYRATIVESGSSNELYVIGTDLNRIDLAFALTVHKLQGSQARVIIFALLPVGKGDFISRNMINTGISRARDGVYMVGDILGSKSCVRQGRKIEQTSKRVTMLDKF